MFRKLSSKSEFFRSIVVLTSGTIFAQILSYAVTPIITRLFTADDFGEIGMFSRIVTFLTALGTARYELTLPLPKNQNHAFQLFLLSLRIALITVFTTLILGLVYWLLLSRDTFTLLFVLILCATTFFIVFKNIGINWAIRNKAFKRISMSNILTSLTTNGFKLIAGIVDLGVIGLLFATMLGAVVGAIFFLHDYFINKRNSLYKKSRKKMYVLSREYKEFPYVNLPHTIVDATRELLIAFFVVQIFSQSFFGSYDLSFKMLRLPLILIGVSLGQIFYNKCSSLYANNKSIFPLLKKTTLLLSALSVIPFGVIFLFGEPIFIWVFGQQWGLAGQISEVLAPWLMANFVASPISTLPMILGKQVLFFWLGMLSTIIQLVGFGLVPLVFLKGEPNEIELITWISYSMALFLSLVTVIKLKIARDSDRRRSEPSV
jgi:O-antigen/teichoic acid export membrane protein